ncbi:hypothetical protein DPMN_160156 [Dreissena polymorpha]|uniref:Uncharacterized protein n=1 Tax=Dreissena polymorpha TaxID=45954 RepID=A0A9D4EKA3_DREPO|nr:hypothetical protein DPMN_160156 [Dreissena polymorpha]
MVQLGNPIRSGLLTTDRAVTPTSVEGCFLARRPTTFAQEPPCDPSASLALDEVSFVLWPLLLLGQPPLTCPRRKHFRHSQ